MQQGDDVQLLCVLIEGAATIVVQDAIEGDTKRDTSLCTYMPGDFFGELALLTGQISVHTRICVCPLCMRVYVCGMCQVVTLSLSLSLSHTHTHTHTHPLSLYLSLSQGTCVQRQ